MNNPRESHRNGGFSPSLDRALTASRSAHLRHFANLFPSGAEPMDLIEGQGIRAGGFSAVTDSNWLTMAYCALLSPNRHRLPARCGCVQADLRAVDRQDAASPKFGCIGATVSRGGSIFKRASQLRLCRAVGPRHSRQHHVQRVPPVDGADVPLSVRTTTAMRSLVRLTLRFWSYFLGRRGKSASSMTRSRSTRISTGRWSRADIWASPANRIAPSRSAISRRSSASGSTTLVYGGSIATDVVSGYEQAWKDFGRIGDNGHYKHYARSGHQGRAAETSARPCGVDAWCGSADEHVEPGFSCTRITPGQAKDFLKSGPDGAFLGDRRRAPPLVMGQTIVSDSCDFSDGWPHGLPKWATTRRLARPAQARRSAYVAKLEQTAVCITHATTAATDADGNRHHDRTDVRQRAGGVRKAERSRRPVAVSTNETLGRVRASPSQP